MDIHPVSHAFATSLQAKESSPRYGGTTMSFNGLKGGNRV